MLAACSDDPMGPSGEQVTLPGAQFFPEGVAFDRDGRHMFVSSILTGQIVRVTAGSSTADSFLAPGAIGASAIAISMSRANDLLWICLGTFGSDAPPALLGVDATTGAEIVRHHFPPQRDGRTGGLCNEITEDAAGNVYASDSFGSRLVRVLAADRVTPDRATVWAEGPELAAPMFGVNGIAFDGARAILAVNTSTGALHSIAVADAKITPVELARPLAGPDGLRLQRPGRAIVVEQGSGSVSAIDLASGAIDVLATDLREPTSLDLLDNVAWVSEGQLHHIFDMTAPGLPFQVVRVPL
jgi:sugar lactone lactonase YvrE